MFGNTGFLHMMEDAQAMPHITVSREEFIRLMVTSGKSKKDAKLQAKVASIMGSHVMIGKQMVAIKRD